MPRDNCLISCHVRGCWLQVSKFTSLTQLPQENLAFLPPICVCPFVTSSLSVCCHTCGVDMVMFGTCCERAYTLIYTPTLRYQCSSLLQMATHCRCYCESMMLCTATSHYHLSILPKYSYCFSQIPGYIGFQILG